MELVAPLPIGPPPLSRPRRVFQERLLNTVAQENAVSPEQAHINQRFAGLNPTSFDDENPPRIFATQNLDPPPGFSSVWHTILPNGSSTACENAVDDLERVCLIFVNLLDVNEVQTLLKYLRRNVDNDSPYFFIIGNSLSASSKDDEEDNDEEEEQEAQTMFALVEDGADDIILGDPRGHKLACTVRSRISYHNGWSKYWSSAFYKQQLARHIHSILWDYLRLRMDTHIPEIDHTIAVGEPDFLSDYKFGKVLGQGAFGKVFELKSASREESTGEVIKCFSKEARNNVQGLKDLKNQIVAMECCSLDPYVHPNITALYEVYHSRTHIFLRMESGGPEDLGRRLISRDSKNGNSLFLPTSKSSAIMSQVTAAVAHLHSGPRIAHRDIKPDNIILSEQSDDVLAKLTDFGLAKIVRGNPVSRSVAGTLPYMSPEMVLEGSSSLFSSDIWSLGVVYLDVLVFARFIERYIFKNQPHMKDKDATAKKQRLMGAVYDFLQKSDSLEQLLQTHTRQELQGLRTHCTVMLEGMLNVMPSERWTYKDLMRCIEPVPE